jgi:hypothetical protein
VHTNKCPPGDCPLQLIDGLLSRRQVVAHSRRLTNRKNRLRTTTYPDGYRARTQTAAIHRVATQSRGSAETKLRLAWETAQKSSARTPMKPGSNLRREDRHNSNRSAVRKEPFKDRIRVGCRSGLELERETTPGNNHFRRGSQLREMTNIEQPQSLQTHS